MSQFNLMEYTSMHLNYYRLLLILGLTFGLASAVRAAQVIDLQRANFNALKQKFEISFQEKQQKAFISRDELRFIREHQDKNKVNHLRLQQYYAGYPVFGGYAILHSAQGTQSLLSDPAIVTMNGVVYQDLVTDLGRPENAYVQNAALALADFKKQYDSKRLSQEQVTPMVYMDEQHVGHWAYRVSVLVEHEDKIPERPTALIDAKTFKPFVEWNEVKTEMSPVYGWGFGGNLKRGFYQYGKDFPLLKLTRDPALGFCFMENPEVRVVDMGHRYNVPLRQPMRFECKTTIKNQENTYVTGYSGDGYDRSNGAAAPSNDALYVGYVVKHMYSDWYGVEALRRRDRVPMQLIMRVHYGEGYENAYWDSVQMTFGDGEQLLYPLVSIGVGGHEVSHGFTEQNSGLMYFGQSGGLNESFSDMAAQAAEFYAFGKNSWKIGSEIIKEDSGYEALRFMDQPSKDGMSIDSAEQYSNGLDVHYSSGVYNRFFYVLATRPDWDVRKAFEVMLKANMDYWTPYVTFEQGACAVLKATEDLGYSVNAVKASLDEVKVHHEACSPSA